MNLLGAILYDPSTAATKACTANIAMTAFDTTNIRLTVTVPAHGFLHIKLACQVEGAATFPQVLLGVMEGSTIRGRVVPDTVTVGGTALATTRMSMTTHFTIPGLTPGSITLDAAYGVEFLVAASNIRYGGPNDSTASNAWGAFVFEIWDPRPLPTAAPAAIGGLLTAPSIANTGLAVTTATNLTNLPAITSNWLTAAGIAAGALNGKGDWNIGKTGYTLTQTFPTNFSAMSLTAAGLVTLAGVTHTGAVIPTVTTVTGLTASNLDATISSRMASYTQPTGFLAATFPTTVASTTNITAGTITTATNVTTVNGLAANVVNANALATDAVTEIQTGLATSSALATVQADTDNIQTRLPAALVGGKMDSTATIAGTVDANVVSMAITGGATIAGGLAITAATDSPALLLTGNGTGSGIKSVGGTTGHGMLLQGGASAGSGLRAESTGLHPAVNCVGVDGVGLAAESVGNAAVSFYSGSNHGIYIESSGIGSAINAYASGTGDAIHAESDSGYGVQVFSTGSDGVYIQGSGTGSGIKSVGGDTGHGMQLQGGASSGDGLHAEAFGSGSGILGIGTTTGVLASGGIGISAEGTNGAGALLQGGGVSGPGLHARGSDTHSGAVFEAGYGSGRAGLQIYGDGLGSGINSTGGDTGHGMQLVGGASSGDGLHAEGTAGLDISGPNNDLLTGAVVDADVKKVNGVTVTGTGTVGDEWGP